MAISYPVALPTINGKTLLQSVDMRLKQSAAMTESSTNFKQLIVDYHTARWEAEVTIRPLDHTEAKVFQAFLASLRGIVGTFTFGDPLMKYTTAPTVKLATAEPVGNDNLRLTNTGVVDFDAGSHFELGGNLYVLLEDLVAGATADREIMPRLKEQQSINTFLNIDEPTGSWRMSTNDLGWSISTAGMYSFTFSCIEAL